MALTVTVETGAIVAGANSYISRADADLYFEGRLNATDWTGAANGTKDAALVWATRVIDASVQFNGYLVNETQALQWPRQYCPNPDALNGRNGYALSGGLSVLNSQNFLASDSVPKPIRDAQCEMALALIKEDRTKNPIGEGLQRLTIVGDLDITFRPDDRQPVLPLHVQNLINKYAAIKGGGGSVRTIRT